MNVRTLPRGRRKEFVTFVPAHRSELRQRGCHGVNRVARELGIGDMALDTLDRQRCRQRAAPTVLDHVAQAVDRGGLADHAEIDGLSGGRELLDDFDGAVDRRALLVGRDQQRDGAGCRGMVGDEALDCGHECRERRFHIGGAAAVQPAVALGRHERFGLPSVAWTCRHNVGVGPPERRQLRHRCPRGHAVGRRLRKPRGASRAASSDWQPASSGVNDGRAISSRASASVGSTDVTEAGWATTSMPGMLTNRPARWRLAGLANVVCPAFRRRSRAS